MTHRSSIPLVREELHVWAIPTEDPPVQLSALRSLLSEEERQRADRFRFAEDRHRSVLARGMLRVILGSYLDAAPEELAFAYGEQGKPVLASGWGRELSFNLSHSGEWVLIGVSGGRLVGIDVERMREMTDLEGVMERFFAPREARAIRMLPPPERTAAFFNCWTRKEAYIKAVGAGLSLALDSFEVNVRPAERARLLALGGSAERAADWTLWGGVPATGYVAAAAAAGQGVRVVSRYWSGSSGISSWQPN